MTPTGGTTGWVIDPHQTALKWGDRPKRNGNRRGVAFARETPRLTQPPIRKCYALPNDPNGIYLLQRHYPRTIGWLEWVGRSLEVQGKAFAAWGLGKRFVPRANALPLPFPSRLGRSFFGYAFRNLRLIFRFGLNAHLLQKLRSDRSPTPVP